MKTTLALSAIAALLGGTAQAAGPAPVSAFDLPGWSDVSDAVAGPDLAGKIILASDGDDDDDGDDEDDDDEDDDDDD
ncbi:MAG: hypothetical protein EP307_11030 [Rhodobacteraceae bacterium]|nr:MAG: hypothetical protein EP307_11030 [Paracoccaceae bacterium]